MSLLKELEALSHTAPEIPDTEGDQGNEDSLRARLEEPELEAAQDHRLRKRIGGTELLDPRYRGIKVNANDVFEDEYEPKIHSHQISSDEKSDESMEEEAVSGEEDEESGSGDDSMEEEIISGEEDEEPNSGDDSMEGNSEDDSAQEDKADIVVLKTDTSDHKDKAKFVQRQLKILDQLLYVKIRMHAAMRAFNELPRGKLAQNLLKEADEVTKKQYMEAKHNTRRLLQILMESQAYLISGSKTMKDSLNESNQENDDDEEIESSADELEEENDNINDDEEEDDVVSDKEELNPVKKHGRSWQAIARNLAKTEKQFDPFRRATIEKWDEKTRLVSSTRIKQKDFNALEDRVVAQIDTILRDKARLLRKTRINRSTVERIGKSVETKEDPECFDDNDFYNTMLKELLEKRTDQTLDSTAMTRQWLELQKYREKRFKRKVDTKASKGRKIRYKSIPKLVNFFPAFPEAVAWSHEKRNGLFSTLFT